MMVLQRICFPQHQDLLTMSSQQVLTAFCLCHSAQKNQDKNISMISDKLRQNMGR